MIHYVSHHISNSISCIYSPLNQWHKLNSFKICLELTNYVTSLIQRFNQIVLLILRIEHICFQISSQFMSHRFIFQFNHCFYYSLRLKNHYQSFMVPHDHHQNGDVRKMKNWNSFEKLSNHANMWKK